MTMDDCAFTLECLPEPEQIEGNASAWGEPEDSKYAAWIREELSSGNDWAWCMAKVSCFIPAMPEIVGDAYLGGCSYKSEKDFKEGGYYDDMKQEAFDNLVAQLRELKETICHLEV